RFARQACVGIEREDKADLPQLLRITARPLIARIRVSAQKPIKLDQLAALPLPTHPAALHGIPQAAAMNEEKTRMAFAAVPMVQGLDLLARGAEQALVF